MAKVFKIIFYFSFILLLNSASYAHFKGIFETEEKANEKSLKLGCSGTHKKKDKWLPCRDEKELHKFLRK